MILKFEDIESLFEEIDAHLKTKVNVYVIGGAVLLHRGLKPSTKDIDFIVNKKEEYAHLHEALKEIGFAAKKVTAEYRHFDLAHLLKREDFQLDLFHKKVCSKFSLSKNMIKRSEKIFSANNLCIFLCSNEDVFLFKTMTDEWMREELILDIPHRQVVFTIPKMLRIFFKFNRSLLSSLCVCGKEALIKYLKATTETDITPGIIAVIQSFGSRINFHPHLHFLVTEGGTDKKGQFRRVPHFNDSLLCRFFTLEVFSLLLRKQLINKDLVQKILHWRHTGFNVHSKVIDKIIKHLNLTFKAARPPPPQAQLSMAAEEPSEYM